MHNKENEYEEPLFEFENLEVYKKAIEFVGKINNITENFPKNKFLILTSQLNRSALSIPLNLAEGFGSYYQNQKKRYFRIA